MHTQRTRDCVDAQSTNEHSHSAAKNEIQHRNVNSIAACKMGTPLSLIVVSDELNRNPSPIERPPSSPMWLSAKAKEGVACGT